MSEWVTRPLSVLADVRVSNVDKKSLPCEKPVLLCNYMDAYANDYIRSDIAFMEATASAAEIAKFKVDVGDLVVTKDSETPDDIGISAVVTEQIDNLVCGYHLALLKTRKEFVDPVFLCKQLGSYKAARYFGQRAAGSTRYGLSNGALANFPVSLPGLLKQKRIATILTGVDTTIEKTEALIAKYQQIKAGLMHDLFTRGVLPNGQLRPRRELAPELYQETCIGWIPREWECQRLGLILAKSGGYLQTGPFGSQLHAAEYQEEGVPVVMPQDINDGLIQTTSIARISEFRATSLARHRLKAGDIIIARRGELSRAAAVGPTEVEWVCGTGCFLLRLGRTELNHFFFQHVYRHDFIQRQIAGMQVGSTMPSLNNDVMSRLFFPFPSATEQGEMTRRLDLAEQKIGALHGELLKLKQQKQGLMHDLLTGIVPVKVEEAEVVDV